MSIKASPSVINLAKELDVDLNLVNGTGKKGFITKNDLISYHANHKTPEISSEEVEPEVSEISSEEVEPEVSEISSEEVEPEVSEISSEDVETSAKAISSVGDTEQVLIDMIGDPSISDPIVSSYETAMEKGRHLRKNEKAYKERSVSLPPAHIRANITFYNMNQEEFSELKTWGELAHSDTYCLLKLVARLAIVAGGFADRPINDRDFAGDLSRWYRGEVLGEDVPAPKKRGRPSKPVDPNAPVAEKRPRGRPRKNSVGNTESGQEHPYLAMRRAREAAKEAEEVKDISEENEEVKDESLQEA